MKTKKIISMLLSVVVMSALAVGCGTKTPTPVETPAGTETPAETPPATTESKKIGVLIYKFDDTYISSVRQALEALDKADDSYEFVMQDGQNNQGTQNDQLDNLISQGVSALVVNIVDIGAAQNVIDKAKTANLPVIFFNREPDSKVLSAYDKARFVGTKPEEAGIIQGEMMATLFADKKYDRNGDGVIQYVLLHGGLDNPEAVARSTFSVKTMEEKGIKTEELAMQVADWDNEKAKTAVDGWLQKHEADIDLVIANNDGMASGAISSLKAMGYNTGDATKYIPVFGVDATEDAKNLIKEGSMAGTVMQDAAGMAKGISDLAKNVANGKDFLDGTKYEYDESKISVRIPYQAYTGK